VLAVQDRVALPRTPGVGDVLDGGEEFRLALTQGLENRGRLPYENAAVPVIFPGGDKLLGRIVIGLLSKALHAEDADPLTIGDLLSALDVNVAGRGIGMRNAYRYPRI